MTLNSPYIEVAVALPVENTFTYRVPETLSPFVSTGKRVLVPFGRRRVTAYVLSPTENTDKYEIRLILDVLDDTPIFPSSMIPFFKWIAGYYLCPVGEVIRSALPRGLNLYDFVTVSITQAGKKELSGDALTPLQRDILDRLDRGSCRLKDLSLPESKKNTESEKDNPGKRGKREKGDIPNSLIQAMDKQGWIVRERSLMGGRTKPRTERHISLNASDLPAEDLSEPKKKIIDIVKSEGEISVRELKKEVPTAPRLIKSLEKSGHISIFEKNVYRDPFGEPVTPDRPLSLTEEQEKVMREISGTLGNGFAAYLLAGVTGSGKTEVYMQLAAEVIRQGRSVLVLIPEIALISQMERRFRARFGECIAVLHSGLSTGERYDQWMRIINNEVTIAIGARSAIFAPFADIGLIIVDEEHDTSYKQESNFTYNARDIAVVRAKLMDGIALMGSATPSIQSYHNVTTGKFTEVTLSRRVEKRPLPDITVVDLRKSRDERGIRRFITPELHHAMSETFARGEQSLIFLNRRGFAGFPVCAACGDPIQCENCDVTLTLHRAENAYKCHYCGFTLPSASRCPTCNSPSIKLLGLGTEKVESAIRKLFPNARAARMDRDTTSRKGSVLKILKGLRDCNTDILVGTQMVAKGHDFPNITLVGIICADLSLCHPDFRAGERTFQLLAQVSGRAGRGDVPGRVILQTYNPEHFSIVSAVAQDFKAFYNKEVAFRKALSYPPYSRLIQLRISGKEKGKTRDFAREMGNICKELQKSDESFSASVQILGPIEAPVSKIAKRYRWQILLKGLSAGPLHRYVRRMMARWPAVFHNSNIKVTADVDPFFMG
ncbi:primosomal protein N' [Desulfobacterales bacterium HSG2]|nr:primosomal protein N' [Desulfobacterales bacterium HSG2]